MRAWLIAGLLLALVGCGETPRPAPPPSHVDADRLTAAKRQYSAFLDEAARAMRLLEAHPQRDALRDQSKKLHEVLDRADDVYPDNARMTELIDGGRMMARYFDACLKVAEFQARRKDIDPATGQKYVDKTCAGNLGVMRQLMGQLREKVEQ